MLHANARCKLHRMLHFAHRQRAGCPLYPANSQVQAAPGGRTCIVLLSAHTWTTKHQITGYVAPLHTVFSTGGVPSFMPTFSVASSAALLPSAALVLTTPAGPSHLSSLPPTPPTPTSSASIPGAALVPPKLVSKILRGEFIEMREMLPDAWVMDDQPTSCCRSSKPRRGGLITDIQLWVEGYASLVAALTTKHPDKAPHFMAYLKTIVHASRNFEGSAWASYDAAYRRKAASTQSFDWAVIDSALYSEAFTGRARTLPRCRYCLSDTHHSRECPYSPQDDPAGPPLKVPRSSPGQPPRLQLSTGVELCGLFNRADGNQCRYRSCRYAHICARCRTGPHPAADCGKQGPKTSQTPRVVRILAKLLEWCG